MSEDRKTGFSLLEVLVALALFGIAAGGMLTALGHHLKNVAYMQDHARALRIASREMDALRRLSVFEEAQSEETDGRFFWTTVVTAEGLEEFPLMDGAAGTPARLSVVVQWSDTAGGPPAGRVRLDGFEWIGETD